MLLAMTQPVDDPIVPLPGARLAGTALGIDVGGTGVKAALVDCASGTLISNRVRLKTPDPSTPEAVARTIADVVQGVAADVELPPDLAVGCGLPGVVKYGRLLTASNIDKSWLNAPVEQIIGDALGRPVHALNDADAAGVAEMSLGVGRGMGGTVLLLTIGTGIGSALFIDGRLLPNTELGHLELDGREAELELSGAARERRGLRWREWAVEFNAYLARVELYFWPDLLIFSGGVSKSLEKYAPHLETRAPVVAAHFLNTAGIVGAAMAAVAARSHAAGGPAEEVG
jgi:polyphosphate glucokinase